MYIFPVWIEKGTEIMASKPVDFSHFIHSPHQNLFDCNYISPLEQINQKSVFTIESNINQLYLTVIKLSNQNKSIGKVKLQ